MSVLSMLNAFGDPAAREELRKDFRNNFLTLWKCTEKQYCEEHKKAPVMDEKTAGDIMALLDKCPTPFHIDALKQMVLVDWQVPNSFEDLDREASKLIDKSLKT